MCRFGRHKSPGEKSGRLRVTWEDCPLKGMKQEKEKPKRQMSQAQETAGNQGRILSGQEGDARTEKDSTGSIPTRPGVFPRSLIRRTPNNLCHGGFSFHGGERNWLRRLEERMGGEQAELPSRSWVEDRTRGL